MAFRNGKTTIVLGAGASKEAGLPTGQELKSMIADLVDIRYQYGTERISGSKEIDKAFRLLVKEAGKTDINPYLKSCLKIRDAMPQAISIDNYLDVHAKDEYTIISGKLAIAQAILVSEKSSSFYVDSRSEQMIDFSSVEDTWFNKFVQILTENCPRESLVESLSNVSVISFNYDRCFEQFLYYAIKNYYQMKPQEVASTLRTLDIHHPYGRVGSLPWQNEETPIEFGANPQAKDLLETSAQIRTFNEGTDPEYSDISMIRESIVNCQRLIFLGFAYHPMNMELLGSEQDDNAPLASYGTAKGLSKPDCEIVEQEIKSIAGKKIGYVQLRNDLTCSQLLNEYKRSLYSS